MMKKKHCFLVIGAILFSLLTFSQTKLSEEDSIYFIKNVRLTHRVSIGDSSYTMPVCPKEYSIQLVGSDNLSVIESSGRIFTPLNNIAVDLLFKAIKIADSSSMELRCAVNVEGRYNKPGTNNKPFVIPSLREWYGLRGNLVLTTKSRIVLDLRDKDSLLRAAKIFQNDLNNLFKISPMIIAGVPKTGDIFLSLTNNEKELGETGYSLSIKDHVSISAPQYRGLFTGTRTILQILEQDATHCSLPKGLARDYPKYEIRGFMLDAGRKYFTIDFLRDYVKMLSYYKMSDFHLHLNDNASLKLYKNNWDSTYSGFRLQNDTYPQLPTKGEFYTKKEFMDLQLLAEDYGVRIIPEIDVPAHSLAFSKAFPQIASKEYGKNYLDLKKPETYTIIENVFREYLEGKKPLFRFSEVHIGTDEYDAKESEQFRKFTDHFIKFVQSFGKGVRVWGALTEAKGTTPVAVKGVTMNMWYNGYADPLEMKNLGYKMISTPDAMLYIVPAAGYYNDYLKLENLYNKWEPVVIGKVVFNMGDPFVRGGMFAVWNDKVTNGITAQDITDRVYPALQVLSEKMWSGRDSAISYNTFSAGAKNITETPGLNIRGKISAKDSLVIDYELKGNDKKIILHHAGYTKDEKRRVLNLRDKNSYAKLPYNEIGYNYTVCFDIKPSPNNVANAVVFQSNHAIVKLKQGNTSNFGFSHEGKDYDFGVGVKPGVWSNILITGDNNSTTLYLDGKLVKKLTRVRIPTGNKTDSIWFMQTLFFPLKTIGGSQNSFIGQLKNLKVFNQILSTAQVQQLSKKGMRRKSSLKQRLRNIRSKTCLFFSGPFAQRSSFKNFSCNMETFFLKAGSRRERSRVLILLWQKT